MENEVQKVNTEKVAEQKIETDRRIVIYLGGRVEYQKYISPTDLAGYIHLYFNQQNFELLKRKITEMKYDSSNTDVNKKQLILENGNWNLVGLNSQEEATGFILSIFNQNYINMLITQAYNVENIKKADDKKPELISDGLHRKITVQWGGEIYPEGFISPYDTVGYIHTYFNQQNFELLKRLISGMNFINKNTIYTKKNLILEDGNWRFEGFDTREEALGFLLQCFSPNSINAMITQSLNTVPVSLRKLKEIDMIFKAINDTDKRLESIEKKLNIEVKKNA